MKPERQVRIPQPLDIKDALKIYWEKHELTNDDIRRLFGQLGTQRIVLLKKIVKEAQEQRGIKIYDHRAINTKVAYEVWGFPYNELYKRFKNCEALKRENVIDVTEDRKNEETVTELH